MLLAALSSVTLGLPTNVVNAAQAPAPLRPDHAQVLVIIADHASGTTEFGGALNTHPCVFNLAEPFAAKDTIWAMNDVAECTGLAETDQSTAIFNADTGSMIKSSNPVLTTRAALLTSHAAIHGTMFINNARVLKRGIAHIDMAGDSPALYAGLPYDFGEYAVRIRDQICKNVPADVCAPADCVVTFNMMPSFVNAPTYGQNMKDDAPDSLCVTKKNELAMNAWKQALASMKSNPKIATFSLTRNERERQFAIFQANGPMGAQFDCSIAREPSEFLQVAQYPSTDDQMTIEECLSSIAGADRCLSDALSLVGLSVESMGGKGSLKMTQTGTDMVATAAVSNCKRDQNAIYQKMESGEMVNVASNLAAGAAQQNFGFPAPQEAPPQAQQAPPQQFPPQQFPPQQFPQGPTPEGGPAPWPHEEEFAEGFAPDYGLKGALLWADAKE